MVLVQSSRGRYHPSATRDFQQPFSKTTKYKIAPKVIESLGMIVNVVNLILIAKASQQEVCF